MIEQGITYARTNRSARKQPLNQMRLFLAKGQWNGTPDLVGTGDKQPASVNFNELLDSYLRTSDRLERISPLFGNLTPESLDIDLPPQQRETPELEQSQ